MVLLEQFELTPPCPLLHAALGQRPLKMRRFLDFSAPRLREALAQLDTPRSVTPIPGIGSRSLSAPLLMTGFDPLRSLGFQSKRALPAAVPNASAAIRLANARGSVMQTG